MAKKNLLAKAEAHANAGRVKEATDICRAILKKTPAHIEATFLLSGILMLEKRFQESEPLLRKVLAKNPAHVSAMNNLGVVYREYYKDLQTAESLFKKVIEANPGHFRALMNLGNIYCDQNRDDLGAACYEQALSVNPGAQESASFHAYLGNICYRKKEFEQAIAHFEAGLKLSPDNTDILRNFILARLGKGDKAALMAMIKDVLKLPDAGRAYFPIFSIAKRNCFWEISDECAPRVLDLIRSGHADFSAMEMSNLDLLAVPGISYETLLEAHRVTGDMLEGKRMRPAFDTHEKALRETARLKIGYLSGDFRGHVVNTFIRGLFNFHDRACFEIYCYSNTEGEDATTAQYKKTADAFIDIKGMTDAEAAEKIHADGIHILINLAGYTHGSRMEVLSYKPAPVQMMYLGYPYTSGLSTVDYIISDPYLDGPENAQYFVEKQLRLPECFVTFDSLLEQEITPDPPFKRNGCITFGCLVNPYKLTPETVKVWSRILSAVPDSRLVLNNPHYDFDQMRARILEAFASEGIDRSRVDIIWERHESGVHLRYYNDIDIALDTFPLTGGTTTHEALWMGVPVVTRVGDIYPYRISYSLLSNVGMDLSELIAFSSAEYIEKAVALAKDTERIEALRRNIPIHLKTSIQCDPIRHTKQMEAAYVEAWNRKFPAREICFETAGDAGEITAEVLFDQAVQAAKDSRFNQA
ncbi:MAG: tetratricopeptide repeat protein, partial [Nitrospiria bacterium]